MAASIPGFSKLSRENKIIALGKNSHFPVNAKNLVDQFRINQPDVQNLLDALSENTLTNFPLPYGIAPNFVINGQVYHIPFVTEESSVVAATSKAAKIWSERGGFHAEVRSVRKTGQVHFMWKGNPEKLKHIFPQLNAFLEEKTSSIADNMSRRGGGIKQITLLDKNGDIPGYYQLLVSFDTIDAMGANFINSCLEAMAGFLIEFIQEQSAFSFEERKVEVIMSILSNYNPECIVEVHTECRQEDLKGIYGGFSVAEYIHRFKIAMDIAQTDVYRAVTHNKGICNGIDAVVMATGNDYRAIEAGIHAFASHEGQYKSLSTVSLADGLFRFSLEVPLTVGTVGGIVGIHPLAQLSLKLLGNPGARELMMIIASAGLASNFAAVNALITSGIQKGHMKMHLTNILYQLHATEEQMMEAFAYFKDRLVSVSEVRRFIEQ